MHNLIFNYMIQFLPIENIYTLSLLNTQWNMKLRKYWFQIDLFKLRLILPILLFKKSNMQNNYIDYFELDEMKPTNKLHIFNSLNFQGNYKLIENYSSTYREPSF